MNIEEIKNEDLEIHWKVKIDSKDVESKYKEELQSIGAKVKMPGFRSGKVPLNIIESKYGSSLYSEVSGKIIGDKIEKFLSEKNIKPSSEPDVTDIKNELGKDIEFLLKVEYLPEISIPDFKKIKIEQLLLEIKDEDIDSELKELAEENPAYKEKKGKAANGDRVKIDFTGRIDGKEFPGGASKDFLIVLGSNSMIPGFENQIVEHKAGEDFTIKVTFPENYHAKAYAGKDAEFDIKIHEVSKPSKPEINDSFASDILGFENLDALKEDLKTKLVDNYKEQTEIISKMKLFDELETLLDFKVPSRLLKTEYSSVKYQTEKDTEFKDSLSQKSQEEIDAYYTKIAARRVRIALLISEYAKLHNISVSSAELQNEVFRRASLMPGYEKILLDFYSKNPNAVREVSGTILENKVVSNIIANEVTLVEKPISKDKLDKLIDKENNKKLSI